jgi:hypothetical protein
MSHPINLTDNPINPKSAFLADEPSDIRSDRIRIPPLHGSANSSELKIITPVDDQYSGHKISSLNILLYYSNHGK